MPKHLDRSGLSGQNSGAILSVDGGGISDLASLGAGCIRGLDLNLGFLSLQLGVAAGAGQISGTDLLYAAQVNTAL